MDAELFLSPRADAASLCWNSRVVIEMGDARLCDLKRGSTRRNVNAEHTSDGAVLYSFMLWSSRRMYFFLYRALDMCVVCVCVCVSCFRPRRCKRRRLTLFLRPRRFVVRSWVDRGIVVCLQRFPSFGGSC